MRGHRTAPGGSTRGSEAAGCAPGARRGQRAQTERGGRATGKGRMERAGESGRGKDGEQRQDLSEQRGWRGRPRRRWLGSPGSRRSRQEHRVCSRERPRRVGTSRWAGEGGPRTAGPRGKGVDELAQTGPGLAQECGFLTFPRTPPEVPQRGFSQHLPTGGPPLSSCAGG